MFLEIAAVVMDPSPPRQLCQYLCCQSSRSSYSWLQSYDKVRGAAQENPLFKGLSIVRVESPKSIIEVL